jgi:hypothetical protein
MACVRNVWATLRYSQRAFDGTHAKRCGGYSSLDQRTRRLVWATLRCSQRNFDGVHAKRRDGYSSLDQHTRRHQHQEQQRGLGSSCTGPGLDDWAPTCAAATTAPLRLLRVCGCASVTLGLRHLDYACATTNALHARTHTHTHYT